MKVVVINHYRLIEYYYVHVYRYRWWLSSQEFDAAVNEMIYLYLQAVIVFSSDIILYLKMSMDEISDTR
jgi:hypothetical protein